MNRLIRILMLGAMLLYGYGTFAQSAPYGNEWINYGLTYYKFKTGKEGIYRINKAALDAAGVPSTVQGSNFILYRNGEEVAVRTTTNGTFSAGDYIEFYGTAADGVLDEALYANPNWQPTDKISLFTDSASYFLTYDNNTNHLRYQQVPNNIPANPPAPLPFCWHTEGTYYKSAFSPGASHHPSYLLNSSRFENGEGYINAVSPLLNSTSVSQTTPGHHNSGTANVRAAILALSFQNQKVPVKFFLNGQLLADSNLHFDLTRGETKKFFINVPANLLSSNNTLSFQPTPPNPIGFQQYGVAFTEIEYPHNFDVNNQDFFTFRLDPSANPQYVEINNFNHGGTPPRLYDATQRVWYEGDISVAGKTRFYIQPSFTERNFILYSQSSTAIAGINAVKTINFTNYGASQNQGNYVVISHKNYMGSPNYVQDYANYRNSAAGGSYNTIVADVTDLYDQFAYGNDIHPLSVKNFLRYAYDKWNAKPEYAFIIGRGLLYHKHRQYQNNPLLYNFPIVPTYGDPGSDVDFVNFGNNRQQVIKIGRLSAWNTTEISDYLQKMQAYENALAVPAMPSYTTELWKKRALHIAGGSDINLQQGILLPTLNGGADIIEDTATGKFVTTVAKNTTSPIDPFGSKTVDSLINTGISILTFHGHSSPGGFDFNLNNPEQYNNSPRLSAFIALGCDVAQIFELSTQKTISERYVAAPNGGSITMIAQDILGFPDFHQQFLWAFYRSLARQNYGKPEGVSYAATYNEMLGNNNSDYIFSQLEGTLFLGDPATGMYGPDKPDYHITTDGLSSIPVNVTTSADSFSLKVIAYNLAKAVSDTVLLRIEHANPAGVTKTISNIPIADLYSSDTIIVRIPVNKLEDLGLNKYIVTIDAANAIDETSEANNAATFNLFIYSDNLIPVYPQEFSIAGQQNITLKASSLNPFRPMGRYKIEIDTTELFNSSLKQQTTINSAGGVIKWTPSLTYKDSTVYYWRTTFDSTINGNYQWTTSSFIYIPQTSGWNQSHYYQYQKNNYKLLSLDNDRTFRYPVINNKLEVTNAVLVNDPNWPYGTADVEVKLNDESMQRSGCAPYVGTLQVFVVDSATGDMWENPVNGLGGSYPRCFNTRNTYAFEFPLNTTADRNNARKFLDSIPAGNYVLIKNFIYKPFFQPAYVDDWKADTLVNGSGISLYHTIKNMGFGMIDSYNKERVFILFRKKGNNNYPVQQFFTADGNGRLEEDFLFPTSHFTGYMTSRIVGPAKQWNSLIWKTTAPDNLPQNDSAYVQVTGIENSGQEAILYTGTSQNLNLSFINAGTYPRLRLEWHSYDSINRTSPQLNYWRVLFVPVPEAALNPAAHYTFTDSVHIGQQLDFSVAIENLTELPMDSMLVRYRIIDQRGVTHSIADKRYKPLAGNDTLHANISIDPRAYAGNNVFFIEANPDNDQPEQYHPNNLGYLPFKVITDEFNPLIDVTFDGVHILDRDIVSAKPFIKISLKDENKYLKLDDTSLISLYVRYPEDGPSVKREVPLDGTTAKFIPASSNGKNEAFIEYRPVFEQDGVYELIVNGEDKTGNIAGTDDYHISFEVINKSTITNILNYPNPFSTATAFLFTITGSQIPSQFKIQIMTVTGKVVREITKNELGHLHIGRNMTEYKWDGKDQYGQMLGNGVYLFRVVTTINGNDIEHRQSGADKFFKNGWGKMYIMR